MCVCVYGIAPFSTFTDRFHLFSRPAALVDNARYCGRLFARGLPPKGIPRGVGMLVVWPCWSSLFRIIPGNTQARTVRIIVRPRANPGKGSRQGLEALPWRYIFGRSSGHGSRLVTQTSLWIISSDASLDTPGFLDFYLLLVFLSLVGIDGTDRVICRELEKKKKTRVSYSWIIFIIFSRIFSNSYEYWLKFIFFFFLICSFRIG